MRLHPAFHRRPMAARRRAQFLSPPAPHGAAAAARTREPAVAALYGNRTLADREACSPAGDCGARRESLEHYLAERDHVSASTLRRAISGDPLCVPLRRAPRGVGESLHAFMLEPSRFKRDYVVPSDCSALDEEALEARTWLSSSERDRLVAMRDAIRAYRPLPLARWFVEGAREWSIYWSDADGGQWKARPDCFSEDFVIELKTTPDVRPQAFARTRQRFGYDIQAAHYLEGVRRLVGRTPRFLFVAIETTPPHYVWTHALSPAELAAAQRALEAARTAFRTRVNPEP